jgi:hypothetical protein
MMRNGVSKHTAPVARDPWIVGRVLTACAPGLVQNVFRPTPIDEMKSGEESCSCLACSQPDFDQKMPAARKPDDE